MKYIKSHSDNNRFSLSGERINTIIERDLALSVVLMLVFRLAHVTDSIALDLIIGAAVVVFCEIISAAVRKASEPTAFRNTGSESEVYANTYDDSAEFEDIPDPQPVRRNKILDELNAGNTTTQKSFSAEELKGMISKASSSLQKKSSASANNAGNTNGNAASLITFFIVICCIISIGLPLLTISSPDDDYSGDYEFEYSDDSIYSSPFYTEEDFLTEQSDRGMEMLMNSEYDEIMSVGDGEGDADALLGMADWSSASWTEESRDIHDDEDTYYAYIRYLVSTDEGEYKVAFRFEGSDLAFDETDAELTGIAACPDSVWEEYDPDEDWGDLNEAVNNEMEYVGDVSFSGYNILTW